MKISKVTLQALSFVTEADINDSVKQALASELKHSETAFVLLNNGNVSLRWFTPVKEVDLCGHATIAAAHALWESNTIMKQKTIFFDTKSGKVSAVLSNGKIELDFSQLTVTECSQI